MSRRDWGHPGVPWYAKREPRNRLACADTRAKLKAYFERQGSLYGGTRCPFEQDTDRPDPGEATEVVYEKPASGPLSFERSMRSRQQLHDDFCFTLTETATLFGVSRERLRQIEASALRKCREAFERLESDGELRMLRDRLRRAA